MVDEHRAFVEISLVTNHGQAYPLCAQAGWGWQQRGEDRAMKVESKGTAMPARRMLAGALCALALAGCTTVPDRPEPAIYHYVRSNSVGSMPENIVHFRRDPEHLAVYKWVARCDNAAYVTADFDPLRGEATTLHAGRVAQDGSQERFGTMTLDQATRRVEVLIEMGDTPMRETLEGVGSPWFLFDYDLADLSAYFQSRRPGEAFEADMALVWPEPDQPLLRRIGRYRFEPAGSLRIDGREALSFSATRIDAPSERGSVHVDAQTFAVLAAEFTRPNHPGYSDFKLTLQRIETGGQAAFDALTRAQHAECDER